MSRSQRQPYYVDGYGSKSKRFSKNYANRVIRRMSVEEDIASGSSFRKINDTWDICDWRFRYNPNPRIYFQNGEAKIIKPEPIYKVTSK